MSSDKPSRRPDSGEWGVDDPSLTTLQVPRQALPTDELETLTKARAPRLDEDDVITVPQGRPSPLSSGELLEDEPVTAPMAQRSPLAPALSGSAPEADDETLTHRISSRPPPGMSPSAGPPPPEPPPPPPAPLEEADDDLATIPANVPRPFEPELPPAAQAPPRTSGLPVPPEPPAAPRAQPFPGRAFGSQLAPTSQLDRPEGPSVGGRAVSVLVAVAVVMLVVLATAMILTDSSGSEAFTELLEGLGLR